MRVKLVRGFFLFGGVRFWYGCPMRLGGTGGRPAVRGKGTVDEVEEMRSVKSNRTEIKDNTDDIDKDGSNFVFEAHKEPKWL